MALSIQDMQRIEGRKFAEDVILFVSESDAAFQQGFIRQLKRTFPEELTPIDVMPEKEAIDFEAQAIPFGIHQGISYGEIPTEYLAWLADHYQMFLRYIKSQRYQDRIK